MTRGSDTRERLVTVAEELMAERGVDAVELNDIRLAAGQRNRSAVNYHFGNRAGLVQAIRQRHGERINDERNRILDDLEARDAISTRTLIEAYINPLARTMRTRSGRNYLIILGDLTLRMGANRVLPSQHPYLESMRRVQRHMATELTGSPASRRIRFAQAALTGGVLLADIARDINTDTITLRQGLRRVPGVIDFVASALAHDPRQSPDHPER